MEEIRSFIAVELPAEVKQKMGELEARIRKQREFNCKWVDPESIHLTLKFLGNVSSGTVSQLTDVMTAAAAGMVPFRLEVAGTGVFPNPQRVRVVWVGVKGDVDVLTQLQQRLDKGLAGLGFPPEDRPFSPHLTIARVRDEAGPPERQALGKLIAATEFAGGSFTVEGYSLMRSVLTRQRPIYSQLGHVAFEKV